MEISTSDIEVSLTKDRALNRMELGPLLQCQKRDKTQSDEISRTQR